MAPFIMFSLWIAVLGPGINEHGIKATQDKGVWPALERAIEEADASTLRGNYGNK